MPGAVRILTALVLSSAVAGCATAEGPQRTDRRAARHRVVGTRDGIGDYPPPAGLSPEAVTRRYVEALDARDGAAYCAVVAPWVSGALDLAGRDPDGQAPSRGCPELVHRFIGYVEDCCAPSFKGARVLRIGPPERVGELVRMPLTAEVRAAQDGRSTTTRLDDVVWLVRSEGAWRVARPSRVASAASLAPSSDGPGATAAPDVAAMRAGFDVQVDAFAARQRRREASYSRPGQAGDCSGGLTLPDPAADTVDYRFPHPPGPPPVTPRADLRSVHVSGTRSGICARFEFAAPLRGPTTVSLLVSNPDAETLQAIEVELRKDGTARATSGRAPSPGRPAPLPARIAVASRTLTVAVDRRAWQTARPSPMSRGRHPRLDRFAFHASATVPIAASRWLHDDLGGDSGRYFSYPDGSCVVGCA